MLSARAIQERMKIQGRGATNKNGHLRVLNAWAIEVRIEIQVRGGTKNKNGDLGYLGHWAN